MLLQRLLVPLLLAFIVPLVAGGFSIDRRSKADCDALWSAAGGASGGSELLHMSKGSSGMEGVLKLYEDCLRSEEGIRYKKSYRIPQKFFKWRLYNLLQKMANEENSLQE